MTATVTARRAGLDPTTWSFVLAATVAFAVVDGFVVAALRGAVGALTRAQSLVTTWLVQAAVIGPILLIALLATVLAVRRRRPLATRGGTVAGALATMAVGLAVGVTALLIDGWIDHDVQVAQAEATGPMNGMVGMGEPGTTASMVADNVDLHLRAAGLGALVLLVAHVLLVGWLVALHGGRLARTRARA